MVKQVGRLKTMAGSGEEEPHDELEEGSNRCSPASDWMLSLLNTKFNSGLCVSLPVFLMG